MRSITDKMWGVFAQALLLMRNKLRGKRDGRKKVLEVLIMLTQISKKIDSLCTDDNGAEMTRTFNYIYKECSDKYNEALAKYGEFDPLTDKRNLFQEAQEEILDAINYLAMALIKVDAKLAAENDEAYEFEPYDDSYSSQLIEDEVA